MDPELDFSRAWHGTRGEAGISSYVGGSSLAQAIDRGLDRGDLSSESARARATAKRQRPDTNAARDAKRAAVKLAKERTSGDASQDDAFVLAQLGIGKG